MRVLETVLYHDTGETAAMRRFYADTLGLREVSSWRDGACFRHDGGVVLLFDREKQSRHGTTGSAHAAFVVDKAGYEGWKDRVEVVKETTWDDGTRSIFFNDPAGNLLEIAEGDPWPA